jgi:hypothetical protein
MNLFRIWDISIPTINIIITAATAVATIRYVWISSKTLREIKLQRETTYLPEIIINSTPFYLKCDNEYGFPVQYLSSSDIAAPSINENITFLTIPIKLYNIGLGSAKKIHFKFEFDVKKIISILQDKKIHLNNGLDHAFKFDYDYNSIMIAGINGQSYFSISEDDQFNSYLLPVNIDKNGADLDLPIHITSMYAIYTFMWRVNHQLMKDCSFPPITIHINYCDINNKDFNKIFQVNLLFKGGGATEIWNKLEVKDFSILN